MVLGARHAAYAAIAFAISCGGTSESPVVDASTDTTLTDAMSIDSAIDAPVADTSPAPDAAGPDAGADATVDAGCSNTGVPVASCQSDAGYCVDYVGAGWTSSNIAGCTAEAGALLVWDAGCSTTGQIGTCAVGQAPYGLIERCYPPLGPNQCQGICLIVDGGYCPN